MTKKDYEKIANALARVPSSLTKTDVYTVLCQVFAEDNDRFNRLKFFEAMFPTVGEDDGLRNQIGGCLPSKP